MNAVLALLALALDWQLGEPRRWHPLVGFGRCASWIEMRLNPAPSVSALEMRLRGVAAVSLATLPPTLACIALMRLTRISPFLAVMVLYFCIGHRSLQQHAQRVLDALRHNDLDLARLSVAMMVSRDTADMDASRIAGATMESVLENGNDAVFGTLFWFLLAGAPGALFYRLANTLDAMWGYRTPRYLHFGWAAARLDDALNWAPARLTALGYALAGGSHAAWACWRQQSGNWESPNAGPVLAAGAGALGVKLGGGAYYHGAWKHRPTVGYGRAPTAADIERAMQLVRHTLRWGFAVWAALLIAANVHG